MDKARPALRSLLERRSDIDPNTRQGPEMENAMIREVCKFFSGSFAALAYAHAAYAVATSRGIISEPVFLGRRWGVGSMWTEAAVYSAASLSLGYAGWSSKARAQLQEPTTSATDGQTKQPVGPVDQSQLVTH